MSDREQPKYRVTLSFRADSVPAIVRLRRFLKMAWRAYGFRCVKVEEVAPDWPGKVPETPAEP